MASGSRDDHSSHAKNKLHSLLPVLSAACYNLSCSAQQPIIGSRIF